MLSWLLTSAMASSMRGPLVADPQAAALLPQIVMASGCKRNGAGANGREVAGSAGRHFRGVVVAGGAHVGRISGGAGDFAGARWRGLAVSRPPVRCRYKDILARPCGIVACAVDHGQRGGPFAFGRFCWCWRLFAESGAGAGSRP